MSIVRMYLLRITADTPDYTFDNVCIAIWSCIETTATVVVACFATLKPLLSKLFPNLTRPGRKKKDQEQNGSPLVQIHGSGRVPTIGSTPLRKQQHQWTQLGGSRDGGEKEVVCEVNEGSKVEDSCSSDTGRV
jgi:hypothetical protein